MASRQKGFTLMEIMVALMIFSGILVVWVTLESNKAQARARETMVARTAEELSILGRAGMQWRDSATGGGAMAPSSRQVVALASLVSSKWLPAQFAARTSDGTLGWSPLGGRYELVAYKGASPSSPVRLIASVSGIQPEFVSRSNIGAGAGVEVALMGEVAAIAASKYAAVGGMINAGTQEIAGNFRGFRYDVTPWFPGPLARPAAAIMIGFDDLNPDVDWYQDPAGRYADCTVSPASASGSGTCPAGTAEVASWVTCNGLLEADLDIMDSPLGKIAFMQEEALYQDARSECGGSCNSLATPGAPPAACGTAPSAGGPRCGTFEPSRIVTSPTTGGRYDPGSGIPLNHQIVINVQLNKAPLTRTTCRVGTWSTGGIASVTTSAARQAGFVDRLCCVVK